MLAHRISCKFRSKTAFWLKKYIFLSFQSNRNTVNQGKVAFNIFNFRGYPETWINYGIHFLFNKNIFSGVIRLKLGNKYCK